MSELLYDFIVKLLKCTKCDNRFHTPATVCINGHVTCKLCSQKILCCQECAGIFVTSNHTLINAILEATKTKNNYLERLIQALECPVCYNQMQRSEMCGNGHGVCKSCATLTQNCPLCRAPYVYNYSSLIKSILRLLRKKIPCTNWSECRTYSSYTELKEHEANCKITFFCCMVNYCKWKGPASSIVTHVNIYHKAVILSKNNSMNFCRNFGRKTYMFIANGKAYWLLYYNNTDGLKLGIQIHDTYCKDTAEVTVITEQQELKLTSNVLNLKDNLEKLLLIPNEIAAKFRRGQHCACNIKIIKQNSDRKPFINHQIMAFLFVVNLLIFCTKAAK